MSLFHEDILTQPFKNGVIAATKGCTPTKMPIVSIMLSDGDVTLLTLANGHYVKCEINYGYNKGDSFVCHVQGNYLLNFVKHAKADTFDITLVENAAILKCGSLSLTVPTSDMNDLGVISKETWDARVKDNGGDFKVKVPYEILREITEPFFKFLPKNSTKNATALATQLRGITLIARDGMLTARGSDGYVMGSYDYLDKEFHYDNTYSMNLDYVGLQDCLNAAKEISNASWITIDYGKYGTILSFGDIEVILESRSEHILEYDKFFNDVSNKNDIELLINTDEMIDMLKKMGAVSKERITLSTDKKSQSVMFCSTKSAKTTNLAMSDEISVSGGSFATPTHSVTLNQQFLGKFLAVAKHCKSKNFIYTATSDNKRNFPVLLTTNREQIRYRYIIMPVNTH